MRIITSQRLRWAIATAANRMPGQCWADLVGWVLGTERKRLPWAPVSAVCRFDAARTGACYCGRLRAGAEAGDR